MKRHEHSNIKTHRIKNMKKISLLITVALFLNTFIMAQDNILALDECIRIGIKNNLSIKKQSEEIRKISYEHSASRAKLLPVIKGFGNFTNNVDIGSSVTDGSRMGAMLGVDMPYMTTQGLRYNTSIGVQLSMPLYNQTLYTSISIAQKMKELTHYSYEKAKDDLILEICKIYYLAQTTIEQIRLTNENINRLKTLADITQAFFDNGMAIDVDIKRVNINIENLIVQRDNAIAMYDQQLNLLKYILNLPFESNLSLVHVSVNEMSAPELTGVSKDLNEFKILYSQKDITKKQIKVINQGYIPSLSLVSQLSYTNYTDHIDNYFHSNISNRLNKWYNSLYWGVSLNIPIFDGFSKQLNRKKANSDYFKVETQIEDTEKKMQIDYDNKIKDWLNNYRNYTKQKDNYLLAEDVYKVTADRYKEGIVSMTELLQDEMRLTDAQNNFINAHYNCRIIKLQLLKLTGKLDKLSNK